MIYLGTYGVVDSLGEPGKTEVEAKMEAKSPGFSSPLRIGKTSLNGVDAAMEAWFLQRRQCLTMINIAWEFKSNYLNRLVDLLGLEFPKL